MDATHNHQWAGGCPVTLGETPVAALIGFSAVAGVAAFARWWGLIIEDTWLAPLMLAMGIQFISECVYAGRLGELRVGIVAAAITRKIMELLAVAMGFTLQRMQVNDPNASPWGHITMGAVIAYELYLFANVCRHFGLPVGPFEQAFLWLEKITGGPIRMAAVREAKLEGKAEVASAVIKTGGLPPLTPDTWNAIDTIADDMPGDVP